MIDKTIETKESGAQKVVESSLKAAGYSYLVGDAALVVAGIMGNRRKEAAAGALYGLGGLVCARYGDPKMDKQIKVLSHRLRDYLKKEKIEIPKTPDTTELTKEGGMIERIEDFLYTYPSYVLNGLFAIGGVQLARSGLQKNKKFDAVAGIAVIAGALGGLLLEEKKPDPDHPPKTALGKFSQWIHERPLRWSGSMYMVNNVALTLSALDERKKNPSDKAYLFKFLTVASYLFANTMLNLSSKAHNNVGEVKEGTKAMQALADKTAQVIAAQHPELQEALLQNIAGYMSTQPGIGMTALEIADLLHTKLATLKKDMPAAGKWQQHAVLSTPAATTSPTL